VPFAKYNQNSEVKEDELDRACSTKGEERNDYWLLVEKSEGRRPLRRQRHRLVDNIKMNLGMEWACMDCIDLAQDRNQRMALVNTFTY
jgi:hypothetical protein